MTPQEVIARRRAEREALVETARRFAAGLDPALRVRAVVVFGSVARGDFNVWSDIDVLVVADHLPDRALERFAALGDPVPLVQAIPWTTEEWRSALGRGDPIAVEAAAEGVWLIGSADELTQTA